MGLAPMPSHGTTVAAEALTTARVMAGATPMPLHRMPVALAPVVARACGATASCALVTKSPCMPPARQHRRRRHLTSAAVSAAALARPAALAAAVVAVACEPVGRRRPPPRRPLPRHLRRPLRRRQTILTLTHAGRGLAVAEAVIAASAMQTAMAAHLCPGSLVPRRQATRAHAPRLQLRRRLPSPSAGRARLTPAAVLAVQPGRCSLRHCVWRHRSLQQLPPSAPAASPCRRRRRRSQQAALLQSSSSTPRHRLTRAPRRGCCRIPTCRCLPSGATRDPCHASL